MALCALPMLFTGARAFEARPPADGPSGAAGATAVPLIAPHRHTNGMPEIVLISPRLPTPVSSPLDIELLFRAEPPARIVPASLRVLYGFFGFDITDRLAKHAEFTESGIRAKSADLPAGSHDITVEISDDRNRVTRRTFHIDVGER